MAVSAQMAPLSQVEPRRAQDATRIALPALLAVFVVLGACYAVVTPLFEVSDELWHYPMVKTLADGHGLPVQDASHPGPWRQEGSQPPLYYAVMALATAWIDTSDMEQVRWINPHADNGVITADGNNNIVIHTYREHWPWRGTVLAVRLIRLLSVLLGAVTVYCTYRLAQEVLPDRPGLALAAAGFVAFTPMFVFISASVNNDNLAIALASAALWRMAAWVRGSRSTPRGMGFRRLAEPAIMGLLLGGAGLSKVSTLGLWPLAGGALLWAEAREAGWLGRGTTVEAARRLWRARLPALAAGLAVMFAVALAIMGWWLWRNFQLYGDWLGWNAFIAMVGARPHPATLAQLWGERVGFVQAYWGLFGGVSVPLPRWTYVVLTSAVGLAVLGLVWAAGRALLTRRTTLTDTALWVLLVAWLVLIVAGLVRWTSLTWASQGRLIFPAAAAIGVLVVFGLAQLWWGLPWMLVGLMGVVAASTPFTVIGPHYAPPPELTAEQQVAISHRLTGGLGADFGGEMRLLGFDLATPSARPGESVRLRLYWQSEIAMDRNWSIFVHVVDDAGVIVAQRDRYPGNGALATSLLGPGRTFAEDYVIPLPEAIYAPAEARLEVGLYDLADGARLPLAEGGDSLTLAPVALASRPALTLPGVGQVPNPFRQNFGNQIELTGYDMDRRALRPGETLNVTLYWRALGTIPLNYSVFAHVRGEGESLWARQDQWPQQGAAPTSTWRADDVIVDPYSLVLDPHTPPGQYDVEVGLYDAISGARLQAIADDGRPTDDDFVFLSKVRVLAP